MAMLGLAHLGRLRAICKLGWARKIGDRALLRFDGAKPRRHTNCSRIESSWS